MNRSLPIVAALMALSLAVPRESSSESIEPDAVTATLSVSQTTYLSRSEVKGTLVVHNGSANRIEFDDALLYGSDANAVRKHMRSFTSSRYHHPEPLQPGQSKSESVPLPSCEVMADPCEVRATVAVDVSDSTAGRSISSNECTYRMVADPTSAFREDGLRGNRTLFVTFSSAIATIFEAGGVLDKDVDAIRDAANDTSHDRIGAIAAYLGAGNPVEGSAFGAVTHYESAPYANGKFEDLSPIDGANGLPALSAPEKSLLQLRETTLVTMTGSKPAPGPAAIPDAILERQHFGIGEDRLPGFWAQAVIDGDDPQIAAVAEISERDAAVAGMRADAAATAIALTNARDFARDLGVLPGAVSLVASLPPSDETENGPISAAAVSLTASKAIDTGWHELRPPSTPPPVPFGVPYAVSVPPPNVAQTVPPHFAPTPIPTPIVPIALPDEAHLLVVRADVVTENVSEPRDRAVIAIARRNSLAQAFRDAVDRTTRSNVRLRHLVLAIAYAPSVNPYEADTPGHPSRYALHAPVELRFRTY